MLPSLYRCSITSFTLLLSIHMYPFVPQAGKYMSCLLYSHMSVIQCQQDQEDLHQ